VPIARSIGTFSGEIFVQKVLITGFDPFGGEPVNPSLEAIKRLSAKKFDNIELHETNSDRIS
jgi:hypothetical protein